MTRLIHHSNHRDPVPGGPLRAGTGRLRRRRLPRAEKLLVRQRTGRGTQLAVQDRPHPQQGPRQSINDLGVEPNRWGVLALGTVSLVEAEASMTPRFEVLPPFVDKSTIFLPYVGYRSTGECVKFQEVIELPGELADKPSNLTKPIIRLLSLAASLSYFKAFAPTPFAVPEGLTARERVFITELIRNGMGEFAYKNQLRELFSPTLHAPTLQEVPTEAEVSIQDPPKTKNALIAVGGGKDSIVTIEALRETSSRLTLFAINPKISQLETARVASLPLLRASRAIDRNLLYLNQTDAPNGHVPVTAINSLIGLLTAIATENNAVIFSNESSASYGNFYWDGQLINHQWSKSVDFERLLRSTLPPHSPEYFSLLRPLTEIRIARRFATHKQYHKIFTSCNRAFRFTDSTISTWCGDCPKCRFAFLILAPFMPRKDLLSIFNGRDLLADRAQLSGFTELLGVSGTQKPFECVGEPVECRVALQLLRKHQDWSSHPFKEYPELERITATSEESAEVFAWSNRHYIPKRGYQEAAYAI